MDPQQLNAYIDAAIAQHPELRDQLEALRSGQYAGGEIPDAANLIPGLRDALASQRDVEQQQQEGQFRDARASMGLRTDASSANVLNSPEWANYNAGQPMAPQAQQPTAAPAVPGMAGGGMVPWGEDVPQWTDKFSFDPSKVAENPSYQFKLSELVKGSDRSAARRGVSFTNQARTELSDRLGGLASDEIGAEYGRQLGSFQTNFGTFDSNRNFAANRADTGWNQNRASQLDAWGRDDSLFARDRASTNDQWGRGVDLWNQNRTDRNDTFDQNYRLSDLVLSRRPRPA